MAFPRRLLVEGEELILDLRPHWIALVGPAAVAILGLAAYIVLLVYAPSSGFGRSVLVWGGLIALFLLLVWYPARRAVRWATSHFVVTSDRVIHRQGWIAKSSMEIPLEAINDVRFSQGVFERIIGAGDLSIESAGERGTNVFSDIRNPEEVQKTIYHQGEMNQQRMMRGGPAPGAPSTTGELERLASLRDRGVLTQEEFEAQKRRILGAGR
ncbi:MAG TPA: PH domain-containing protein [Actinomycetota bacterium]|nr:PH domain-containing protein [Actinomycetota bacterium]